MLLVHFFVVIQWFVGFLCDLVPAFEILIFSFLLVEFGNLAEGGGGKQAPDYNTVVCSTQLRMNLNYSYSLKC